MDNRIRSISISSVNYDHGDQDFAQHAERSPSWLLGEILQQFPPSKTDDLNELKTTVTSNTNKLINLLRENPDIKQNLVIQNVISKISFMFYNEDSTIKACGYKILKECIINEDSLYVLIQNKLLIYLIISLSVEKSNDIEKLYAIKLIQKFLIIKNGCNYLSIGIIKSLVHLLDDDLFIISNNVKALIVEILLEISILNPKLIYHSNGFNLLTRNLVNNTNIVISINSMLIIINLLNVSEFKTKFFRNGYNLNVLMSVFDEESLMEPSKSKLIRIQKVSFLITTFLKNWNGFLCCSLNNFQVLGDLINNLTKHDDWKLKEFILDILLDILNIKSLPWLRNSVIGEFLLKFNPKARFLFNHNEILDASSSNEDFEDEINNEIINHYINHYVGLLTLILIKLNLIDLLHVNLHNPNLNDKVILLLSNLFTFSKLYLPDEFNLHLSYKIDLNSLIKISNYNLNSHVSDTASSFITDLKSLTLQSTATQNAYLNMDEADFRSMTSATKVLTLKEFVNWDWNLILSLFQGPLKTEKKFNDLLDKQPKFFKRLLSFYRPFKFRFCNLALKTTKDYKKIIQVGILMFELLSNHVNGLRYLYKNKIIIQMAEILAQIDPYSGVRARNPILKGQNLISTVNFGYVKFLGKLTETENGVQILNHWQIFQLLNNIIDGTKFTDSNNYFILSFFKTISFTTSKQSINLLFKCLNVCNVSLKLKLIDYLPFFKLDKWTETKIIMNNVYQKDLSNKLMNLIYRTYLDQHKDPDYLKLILSFNPPISIFIKSTKGRIILDQFLLLPEGFEYLSRFNYIENNFRKWLQSKNRFEILKYYESKLNEKLFPYFKFHKTVGYNHFFKHLLDTKEGLNYLQNFDVTENFIPQLLREVEASLTKLEQVENDLRHTESQKGKESELEQEQLSQFEIRNLKQNLWILGEINCSNYGNQLISFEFFELLIQFYDNCTNWNIKSLLFYQLGKLAMNNEGIEILDEKNWIIKYNKFVKFENFGYPKALDLDYFHNELKFLVNFEKFDKYQMYNIDELTEEESIVIELIFKFPSNLMMLEKQPIKELIYLKKNYGNLFNVEFFLKVIKFIDNSNFNFKKRNFIIGLFIEDTNLLELLIRKKK